jgi:hypothetical protein
MDQFLFWCLYIGSNVLVLDEVTRLSERLCKRGVHYLGKFGDRRSYTYSTMERHDGFRVLANVLVVIATNIEKSQTYLHVAAQHSSNSSLIDNLNQSILPLRSEVIARWKDRQDSTSMCLSIASSFKHLHLSRTFCKGYPFIGPRSVSAKNEQSIAPL